MSGPESIATWLALPLQRHQHRGGIVALLETRIARAVGIGGFDGAQFLAERGKPAGLGGRNERFRRVAVAFSTDPAKCFVRYDVFGVY